MWCLVASEYILIGPSLQKKLIDASPQKVYFNWFFLFLKKTNLICNGDNLGKKLKLPTLRAILITYY